MSAVADAAYLPVDDLLEGVKAWAARPGRLAEFRRGTWEESGIFEESETGEEGIELLINWQQLVSAEDGGALGSERLVSRELRQRLAAQFRIGEFIDFGVDFGIENGFRESAKLAAQVACVRADSAALATGEFIGAEGGENLRSTPLGLLLTELDEEAWCEKLFERARDDIPIGFSTEGEIHRIARMLRQDQLVCRSAHRLDESRLAPGLVPSDSIGLRYMYGATALIDTYGISWHEEGADEKASLRASVSAFVRSGRIVNSVPYFMPGDAIAAILDSESPADHLIDDIRLPFASVMVVFERALELAPRSAWWGKGLAGKICDRFPAELLESVARRAPWRPLDEQLEAVYDPPVPALAALYHLGGLIEGVVFSSDGEGRLLDQIIWLACVPYEGRALARVPLVANISKAGLREQLYNLAAIISWGDWTQPSATVGERAPAASAAPSRQVLAPGNAEPSRPRVRVLDLSRRRSAATATEGTGRTTATHHRRGHWHSFRVGARADWSGEYVTHWVAPLIVNPGLGNGRRDAAYRIPDPPVSS